MYSHTRMNKTTIVCAFAILLIIAMGLAPTSNDDPAPTPSPIPTINLPAQSDLIIGEVIRILDADTLLIKINNKTRRYQLLGADAPEFDPKDHTPDHRAVNARRFIEQLLLNESVYIQHEPTSERDSSNRLIAYLFRAPDMLFVNLELVRQGYAKHNHRNATLYTDAFTFYESKAKELNRGIWNPNPEPLNFIDESTPIEESDPDESDAPSDDSDESKQQTTPDSKSQTPNHDQQIYITKYGKRYHLKDCPHLTDTTHPTTRQEADETLEPCKTCKPNE